MCAISTKSESDIFGDDPTAALTLVGQDSVVLRRDIVREVVVEDETQQTVEERKINLLVDLG